MRCNCKIDRNLDDIMERISLLFAYLEQAIKELMKHGVVSGEIGISELEYREVLRGIMSQLDRL